jgi:hypothetical protein
MPDNCSIPTLATLASLTALELDGSIQVQWTTASELACAGFNIHRGLSETGDPIRINAELIASAGGEFEGKTYTFTDHTVMPGRTYYYWLEDVGIDGIASMHGPVSTNMRRDAESAYTFNLAQNSPNPFMHTTEILYRLPAACLVTLTIYDTAGRRVRTLVEGRQAAGRKIVQWDGRNGKGMRVSGGVYFYRLEAAGRSQLKKMVYIR